MRPFLESRSIDFNGIYLGNQITVPLVGDLFIPETLRCPTLWGMKRSDGQSIAVSALASFLPKNTQGRSPLEWTGWISLQSKGLSRVFNTTVQKHQFFGA